MVALIDTISGCWAMIRGSLTHSTGRNWIDGFSCRKSYSRRVPNANVVTDWFGRRRLYTPVTTPGLDQVDHPVGDQLGVDAEVAVIAQRGEHGVGDGADPGLDGRPVGHPLGDQRRDRMVEPVRLDRVAPRRADDRSGTSPAPG